MTRGWLLLLVGVNLLVMLGIAFVYPQFMVAPGRPIAAHADLSADCFACHTLFHGVAPERCIICHAVPEIGVRTTKGAPIANRAIKSSFHQSLIKQDCLACHSDHQGHILTLRNPNRFQHSLLTKANLENCGGCHTAPMNALHIGRDTNSCGQCHTSEQWRPATFDHAKLFLLDRDHNAPCATCHVSSDFKKYTCYGCHEHQQAKILARHRKERIQNIENCVRCHRSANEQHGEREGSEGAERD